MASSKIMMMVAVIAIVSVCVPSTVAQTSHTVGDTFGWNVTNDGSVTYTNWAARQTFAVGDTLVFNFTTGFHDVAEVSQAAFGPCTITNPISNDPNGPATITLSTAGNHYYICTFGRHCSLGQKLSITVAASNSTTPSPANSASSFSAVVPITFLAAALAFFH
ncbi:stellacyanin-like [Bidens hawaiensis]|uniref:stellacyanin-like n=1 Tax=Bidens hawaiensis TaxID=980011 RepID=UPI00404B3E9F